MLFNTIPFGIFMLVVFSLYYLPGLSKHQVSTLVLASMVFYAWSAPWLLLLLIFCITLNSFTSFKVAHMSPEEGWRAACVGVVINLTVLAIFKYASLFRGAFPDTADHGALWTLVHLPLPIGISFYTFEGVSLLVDSLRIRKKTGEPPAFISESFWEHVKGTALFVVFFPHLISGPILKAREFFPQISRKYFADIDWDFAFRTLVLGFFLKTVLADNLKDYTSSISYPQYTTLNGSTAILLAFGYSMQIFADFAGYSLIAIGLGALFGYRLPDNFNWPYISTSFSEFWRRWHISLSTWLRDYLYISLGGNRKGEARTYFNLIIVMALGGLWHGAAISYLVWGLYHGILLAIERAIIGKKLENERKQGENLSTVAYIVRMVGVFAFVTLGWILFKLPNFSEAVGYVKQMTNGFGMPDKSKALPILFFGLPVVFLHLLNTPAGERLRQALFAPTSRGFALRALTYGFLLFAVLTSGGSVGEFIYFQF